MNTHPEHKQSKSGLPSNSQSNRLSELQSVSVTFTVQTLGVGCRITGEDYRRGHFSGYPDMVRHFTIGSLSSSPGLLRLLYKHSVSAARLQESHFSGYPDMVRHFTIGSLSSSPVRVCYVYCTNTRCRLQYYGRGHFTGYPDMVRHFTIGSLSSSPCLLRLLYKHSVSAAGLQESDICQVSLSNYLRQRRQDTEQRLAEGANKCHTFPIVVFFPLGRPTAMNVNLKGFLRTPETHQETYQSIISAVPQTPENNLSRPPGKIHHPCPNYQRWHTAPLLLKGSQRSGAQQFSPAHYTLYRADPPEGCRLCEDASSADHAP
ncbi:hypothetical protein J6590_082024 [Homalodisca vitripennis]|nr:hypothetical protein J6590_082024 [Homalodisca vitripennis]